ncbi:hypothetical protein HG530_007921 [Fusarium avenaceum]|nr:hypothetical protein HG530_007921 [Fusarium avenaceum]
MLLVRIQNLDNIPVVALTVAHSGNEETDSDVVYDKVVGGFAPAIQSICSHGRRVGQWPLYIRKPLQTNTQGRVVVIGDAAHPMPPTRAQGASMAIEDAAALGILLSDIDSEDDIPARLKQFDELRVPRVAATQIISAMYQWDPSKVKDEEKHFFNGRIPQTQLELEEFSYANDVIRDAFNLRSQHKSE